jgi:hypothetical protein
MDERAAAFARPKDKDHELRALGPGTGAVTGTGQASVWIRYAAGRTSRSVSSWMSTAIFVSADECCRL